MSSHIERLKSQRLSTATAGTGVPVLIASDTPLIELPSVLQRWRYTHAYWRGTLRNLTVKHGLRTEGVRTIAAPVTVTPALRQSWHRLFEGTSELPPHADGASIDVPYMCNQSVGTLLYTNIFAQLGINFRHLLHVQHETKHWASVRDYITAERQEVHVGIRGAFRLGEGKALVAVRSAVHRSRAEGGALLSTANDRFIIRNVPDEDLQRLVTGRAMLRELAELRRKDPQLDPSTPESVVSRIRLAPDLGKQFGRVSGDFNPVHTTRLAARLFGIKRPFLQGLGLRNAVIRQLAIHGRPLTRFNISFASPAFLGQTLRLVMQGDAFEVVGEGGEVVAFGAGSAEV